MLDYDRLDGANGQTAFLIRTDNRSLTDRIKQAAQAKPTDTPQPDGDDDTGRDAGGPVTRFTSAISPLGLGTLEVVGLSGHEIADAIQMRVRELYRNEFPLFKPRFEAKCEVCGAEYDRAVEHCQIDTCDGETRPPDPAEKRRAETLVESVNKEGQSLREIAKAAEFDQGLLGVPVLVLRHAYRLAPVSPTSPHEEIISREVEEIVKGDPKRIVPVVDEHRRIGGYWWACPRCRHDPDYRPADEPGYCDDCRARLREVYFAETGYSSPGSRSHSDAEAYYFREEILTFPWFFPRLHGLDGLSPVHHVWLKQAIIESQNKYAGAFFDPESERLPNQFIILHTTNADAWEARLQEARENSKSDQYDSPVFAAEYSTNASTTPEVQVVDAMPDELLGQNEQLKDTFKKDIRQAYDISDVFDSDLGEAGGLNNEGLQIEVTDRSIASQQHDYVTGWLDTLAKRLGIEDHYIAFVPSAGPDADELRKEVEAGMAAAQAGLDARLEDEQVTIPDGEFEAPARGGGGGGGGFDAGGAPGGGGGGFGGVGIPDADQSGDVSEHDFGPGLKAADAGAATDLLFEAHQHMVWPDLVDQKAREPFWSDDESMPEFVKRLIEEALERGAITTVSKHLPASVTTLDVRDFFAEKLDQPQGWSLRSLTEDYADRFGVDEDEAAVAVRHQSKSILDKSRELGYEAQGDTDERRFKWVGPIDDRKTDASWDVLEQTNPDHGGTPRPLEELKAIVQEARRRHFPEMSGSEWADSWQDRDTYVEHFED